MHFSHWISETSMRFIELMVIQAHQLWPYWVSGVLMGALVKQFLKGSRIKDVLSKAGWFAIPASALMGVVSPLCLFGALPVLATFGEAGLSIGATWAFLVSSPLLNPNLFIMTWGGLGAKVAIVRLIVAVLMGIVAGVIVQSLGRGRVAGWLGLVTARKQVAAAAEDVLCTAPIASHASAFSPRKLAEDFFDSLAFTGRYLVAGMALAAAVEILIPQLWVMQLLGGAHSGFAVLAATGLGVPLYMCGGGSVPLIREWMYVGGLSMGGAMAFMVAGPSTKVSNFAALIPALGRKGFMLYLFINLGGAIIVGYSVDLLLHLR